MTAAKQRRRVMGKMVDAQSITIATAATEQVGNEGVIFRFVFWHSIALGAIVGVIVMIYAYVLSLFGAAWTDVCEVSSAREQDTREVVLLRPTPALESRASSRQAQMTTKLYHNQQPGGSLWSDSRMRSRHAVFRHLLRSFAVSAPKTYVTLVCAERRLCASRGERT